jgi:hypothetical protein
LIEVHLFAVVYFCGCKSKKQLIKTVDYYSDLATLLAQAVLTGFSYLLFPSHLKKSCGNVVVISEEY